MLTITQTIPSFVVNDKEITVKTFTGDSIIDVEITDTYTENTKAFSLGRSQAMFLFTALDLALCEQEGDWDGELPLAEEAPVYPNDKPQPKKKSKADLLSDAAEIIISEFSWMDTPEGEAYWDTVHQKLTKLAEKARAALL